MASSVSRLEIPTAATDMAKAEFVKLLKAAGTKEGIPKKPSPSPAA